MQRGFLHKSACKFILICFLVASLSPRYISTLESSGGESVFGGGTENKALVHGIFWLNLVGSKLLDLSGTDTSSRRQAIGSEQEEGNDLLLAKRKRVVVRERFILAPIITAGEFSPDRDIPCRPAATACSVPYDPIHRHDDDYTSLSTGLSPPEFFA